MRSLSDLHLSMPVRFVGALVLVVLALGASLALPPGQPALAYLVFLPVLLLCLLCFGAGPAGASLTVFALAGWARTTLPGTTGLPASEAWLAPSLFVAGGLLVGQVMRRRLRSPGRAELSQELVDLYDHAPCGYQNLGPDGTILRVNATELGWLGCGRDEVVGRLRITDFLTDEGRAAFAREMPDFVRTGVFLGLDVDLVGRHGVSRRVRIDANAVRDHEGRFVSSRSVVYDVSEAHALRLRLLALLDEQLAMLDNELVGIVKLRHGHTVWANRAVHRLFGYAHGELIDQPVSMLHLDAEHFETVSRQARQQMAGAGHSRLHVQMRHRAGHTLWIDLYGSRLDGPAPGGDGVDTVWMMTDITELQEHRLLSEHQARHDPLTGLPNRRLLQDRLEQALARADRTGQALAVCVVDLDGFKPINDRHGHAVGDLMLETLARRMQACVRSHDTVSRSGGDEFIVLLDGLGHDQEHIAVLSRMRDHIAEPVSTGDGRTVAVTASMGVAVYPGDGRCVEDLLARADAAMYHAKQNGHDSVWMRCGL
ncbi:MAG: hypothetical protein RL375_3870 [Pseudomonadota bacterium]